MKSLSILAFGLLLIFSLVPLNTADHLKVERRSSIVDSLLASGLTKETSKLYVPENYSSIQEALNNAWDGCTIYVKGGFYEESLIIDKAVSLIGVVNETVIYNRRASVTVYVKADNVLLANFIVNASTSTFDGIYLFHASSVVIENNTVINHRNGIYLRYSSGNILVNNFMADNAVGIHIYDSTNNTLEYNVMVRNKCNLRVWGLPLEHFIHRIDKTNKVDGRPVYYLVNKENETISYDAGYIGLVNSSRITVYNVNVTNNLSGILLAYTNYSFIWNSNFSNNERGVYLISSHENVVVGNIFESNFWSGISLVASSKNFIASNIVCENKYGMYLTVGTYISNSITFSSDNNTVSGNIIKENLYGLFLDNAMRNIFRKNLFANNSIAIHLSISTQNTFAENNVSYSREIGVKIENSYENVFYENNFLVNNVDVSCASTGPAINYWDNGTNGNYWDKYENCDENGDMIWDQPFVVCQFNKDNFPSVLPVNKTYAVIANFTVIPEKPKVFDSVKFSASSCGLDQPLRVWWNFNGCEIIAGNDFYKTFLESGYYNVTLFVLNEAGTVNYTTKQIYVRKVNVTLLLLSPSRCFIGENLSVTAVLTDEDGRRLVNLTVKFYFVVGNATKFAVTAQTNIDGEAVVWIIPEEYGEIRVNVEFEGKTQYERKVESTTIDVVPKTEFTVVFLLIIFSVAILVIFVTSWKKTRKFFMNKLSKRMKLEAQSVIQKSIKPV
jgi:parallel beta-helix repeat protein